MATQLTNGRAFEWAVGLSFSEQTGYPIEPSRVSESAQSSFECLVESKRIQFKKAADRAVRHILQRRLVVDDPGAPVGKIRFNSDSEGQQGDVRDVMVLDGQGCFGVSCKTNHEALKHPRLSNRIDFVKKWGLHRAGCSSAYWSAVNPVFSMLSERRRLSENSLTWEALENKAENVYWPILDAWEDEIWRVSKLGSTERETLCRGLVSFVVGREDFYKVVSRSDGRLDVLGFNFGGTLPLRRTHYPTHLLDITRLNGGVYSKTLVFNAGWSINFRIHNASSRVEPSLKFDVNAVGLPPGEIHQQTYEPGDLL